MSRFFSEKYSKLVPYVPGEQSKHKYIKLNTNESPFPPSQLAIEAAAKAAETLQLYPDPECRQLTECIASQLQLDFDQVLLTNGSDEILNFAFMAYCDSHSPAVFPDITYGFYSVFAEINNIPYQSIPLQSDFSICVQDYCNINKTIFIANPNAPTGIALTVKEIEKILQSNPDHVVIIDEAYVDFGAESCIPLIHQYDNLLVTQTFSKSRSMAGARLGFGAGSKALIADLKKIKYSTNPYNINAMTMAAGYGTIMDSQYTENNCRIIKENRSYLSDQLQQLGFSLTNSITNFVFARHPQLHGKELYLKLKERGILVRHFDQPKIDAYVRITIGTEEQMKILVDTVAKILEEVL